MIKYNLVLNYIKKYEWSIGNILPIPIPQKNADTDTDTLAQL